VSLHSTPAPAHQDVFYTVPRAGHLQASPSHRIRRDHYPGHELILCLAGRAWTRVAGRTHAVRAGDFVWLNCHHPHEHWAEPDDPWEAMWVRAEGPQLAKLAELMSVRTSPVISGVDRREAVAAYRQAFKLLAQGSPESPALLHAAVARLLGAVCAARARSGDAAPDVPPALTKVVERMRLFYFEKHTLDGLAAVAGLSPTHFTRVFRSAFGTSPIDWLRRERISQAKRRLAGTSDEIKEIAAQVGYADRYFFSKDFKRHTGVTPGQYRAREQGRAD
jgi:AraC family transcriptional regulator, arabinose operon regulatory protein